jgi:hypothetical protein
MKPISLRDPYMPVVRPRARRRLRREIAAILPEFATGILAMALAVLVPLALWLVIGS